MNKAELRARLNKLPPEIRTRVINKILARVKARLAILDKHAHLFESEAATPETATPEPPEQKP